MARRKNPPPTYENTGEWKPAFIAYLREHPHVKRAAEASGVLRKNAYKARVHDAQFAADWDEAIKEGVGNIQDIAIEQAMKGDSRWQTMMIFLMKNWLPERYKETVQNEISGPGGNALTINVVYADATDTGPTNTDTAAG